MRTSSLSCSHFLLVPAQKVKQGKPKRSQPGSVALSGTHASTEADGDSFLESLGPKEQRRVSSGLMLQCHGDPGSASALKPNEDWSLHDTRTLALQYKRPSDKEAYQTKRPSAHTGTQNCVTGDEPRSGDPYPIPASTLRTVPFWES